MSVPKIFLRSARPSETKQVASMLGGLDGQFMTIVDAALSAEQAAAEALSTVEGMRAYLKHVIESVEAFLPGGNVYIEELYDSALEPEALVESAHRAAQWGRQTSLVLPVSLGAIEAGNMLSRMGGTFAYYPVCTLDQAAAIVAATEAAAPAAVSLILPFDIVGADAHTLARSVAELCRASAPHAVCVLSVDTLESFVWGMSAGISALAAPASVITAWVDQGKPMKLEAVVSGNVIHVDMQAEKSSYAISHPLTETLLNENAAAWKKLLQ